MSLLTDASLIVTPNAYKESKLYSVIPNTVLGDMNIVRATTATRVNSAGLIELVPYNLLTWSQDFSNANWVKLFGPTMTYNSAIAPNGTMTATGIQDTTGGSYKTVYQSNNITANSVLTCSIHVKKETSETAFGGVSLYLSGGTTKVFFGIVNAVNGTVTLAGSSITPTITVVDLGTYWRIICTVTDTGANTNVLFEYYATLSTNGTTLGQGIGSVRTIWGAQLVTGSLPKDYLRTETRLNIPRLDYSNGSCPSILVEPQKTNSLIYSNQFDNGIWTKNSVIVTANAAISPEGYANADKLISTAVSGYHSLVQLASKFALTPYTFSFFAKAAEIGFCIPNFSNSFNGTQLVAQVNLTNGAIISVSAGLSASTQNYGNGWFRVILTATSQNNTSDFQVTINTTDAAGNSFFTGNGTSGILIYGAQLEIGSYPTSYIPTTAAIATRNADVISKTGISSLIGPTEGTIYAEINNTLMTSYSTGYVMRIFADANNEVWIRKESGSNKYTAKWRANSVDVYTQSNISVLNGNNKIAIAYKTGNSAVYLNGTQIGTSASTGAFAVAPSQIGIGSSSTADFFNDGIELATVFPTRLTNAQLATLTTL